MRDGETSDIPVNRHTPLAHIRLGGMMCVVLPAPFRRWITG
jgi:hypothetical protein